MKKIVLVFTLIYLTSYMETHARFIVETIYFKPSDIINAKTDNTAEVVDAAQKRYASEMQRHGFGRKTFRLERDGNSKVKVHIVNGRHGWRHYANDAWDKIRPELPNRFNPTTSPWDKQDRIRIIVVAGVNVLDGWVWGYGWPRHSNRYGGTAILAENSGHFDRYLVFHEIGHAFGLYHKPEGADAGTLEHYEARWLDKHYHFNNRQNNFSLPKVEVHNPKLTATKEGRIRMEVIANSDIGLHQAMLVKNNDIQVIGWDYLGGTNKAVISIEGSRRRWGRNVFIEVMDTSGNYVIINMTIDISDVIVEEVPTDMDTLMYSQDLSNVNVLMYIGAVNWMSFEDANLQSEITKRSLASKGIQAEIVQTEDAVRAWMLQTTSDDNVDVLILYGTLPVSIYPPLNSQPDGSVAENWIESTDGNTILNHGDYFGFWGGGNREELGVQNGVRALQALMDIPHITMWDFGLENNTPMVVTKDGKTVTPTLMNFKSDRAFHLDELTGNWFAEKVLASDTGTSQAARADPVIVRDGNRGRIGIVYQTFNEINPKGEVVAELIANFLLENKDAISSTPIDPTTEPIYPTQIPEDVNKDGVVNIADLTLVALNFGKSDENAADVNADGVVNIVDLVFVAAAFEVANSAPGSWHPDLIDPLPQSKVKQWLHYARQLNKRDPTFQRGLFILEQLLASVLPEETALLPNYPNPFNPETWIPYQLSEPADVTLNIYAVNGTLVRTLLLGYQPPGYYKDKNQAAFWDGCNNLGEPVANGIYFYQLQTNEISPLRKMIILK